MIKRIVDFFDYIYYRLGKFYFKIDGKDSLIPVVLITLVHIFIFIDLLSLIYFEGLMNIVSKERLTISKWIYAIIYFLLVIYNYRRYKGKFESFQERWGRESKKVKLIKGFLIILFIISVIILSGIVVNLSNS